VEAGAEGEENEQLVLWYEASGYNMNRFRSCVLQQVEYT
jgi:hypothetical protein